MVPCLIITIKYVLKKPTTINKLKEREWEVCTIRNKLGEKDNKEWCDEVIDALHIATGWVSDGPDEENPLKYLQHTQTHHYMNIFPTHTTTRYNTT